MMPKTYRKDAFIIFLLLTFIFGYFYQIAGWNGNSRFSLIFASIQQRRLTIDSYYDTAGTKSGDIAFANGHYYSDKAIGPSLVGAILYIPFYIMQKIFHSPDQNTVKQILTFFVIGLPSAIAGSLMYILCLFLSKSRFRAFLITMSICLGTLYLPFSVIFFSHQFTASLLFSSFFMIFFLKEGNMQRNNWYLFLIGFLMGLGLISEYTAAVIIVLLIVYYAVIIWRNRPYLQLRSFILPILGGCIPILLQLVYNKYCFGNLFSIGYENLSNQDFSVGMNQGLMGIMWPNLKALYYMTFNPTMGIFWQSPVLLFSFIGVGYMFRKHQYRDEAILAVCIISSYLVILSGYYMWWGGYSVGPRHLIPMLPFFCLFFIFLPEGCNWPFVGLSLVSFGQMLIATASTIRVPDDWIANLNRMAFFQYSNIYDYCLNQLIKGSFTENLGHRLLHLSKWESLTPFFIVLTGLTLVFFWHEMIGKKSASKRYTTS